jgi:hypothetical protein
MVAPPATAAAARATDSRRNDVLVQPVRHGTILDMVAVFVWEVRLSSGRRHAANDLAAADWDPMMRSAAQIVTCGVTVAGHSLTQPRRTGAQSATSTACRGAKLDACSAISSARFAASP